jgi:hypothetical protein
VDAQTYSAEEVRRSVIVVDGFLAIVVSNKEISFDLVVLFDDAPGWHAAAVVHPFPHLPLSPKRERERERERVSE